MIIKNIFLIRKAPVFFLLALLFACENSNRIKIKGEISGADKNIVYLEEVELDRITPIDSARLSNSGTFTFREKTKGPGFYQLRIGEKNLNLLIEPGQKIMLNARYNELPLQYEVEGSDGSMMIMRLNERMAETRTTLDSLEQVFEEIRGNDPEGVMLDSLSKQYQTVIKDQRNFNIVFILNFYNNLASLYALYQKIDNETYLFNRNRDIQYYKILADSLKKYHPESKHVKALLNNTRNLLASVQQRKVSSLMESIEPSLPDIALPNTQKDTISLSSLKGNAVILSFWASWNEASIRENLKLKSIYEAFHQKGLEIYQVSLDNDFDAWTAAIRFDELPWINVCGLDYPNSYAAQSYNVTQLPTHFLINKDQTDILGKNLSTRELQIKLNNLLN